MSKPPLFLFPDRFDPSSKQGAALLASCIMTYWTKKGYAITAERFEVWEGRWGVRSNLVGGLPQKWRGR